MESVWRPDNDGAWLKEKMVMWDGVVEMLVDRQLSLVTIDYISIGQVPSRQTATT